MRQLHYSGVVMATTDSLADELRLYAAELARAGTADGVSVPGLDEHGEPGQYDLLLGPASQLVITDSEVEGELDTAEAEADLRRRREAMRPSTAHSFDGTSGSLIDDL